MTCAGIATFLSTFLVMTHVCGSFSTKMCSGQDEDRELGCGTSALGALSCRHCNRHALYVGLSWHVGPQLRSDDQELPSVGRQGADSDARDKASGQSGRNIRNTVGGFGFGIVLAISSRCEACTGVLSKRESQAALYDRGQSPECPMGFQVGRPKAGGCVFLQSFSKSSCAADEHVAFPMSRSG